MTMPPELIANLRREAHHIRDCLASYADQRPYKDLEPLEKEIWDTHDAVEFVCDGLQVLAGEECK